MKWVRIKHDRKLLHLFINSIIIALAIFHTNLGTAAETNQISGQILINDAGKIQKTGLAPIWVYDATNFQWTDNIALPDFGGRSRKDLARIRASHPGVITVCSNYQSSKEMATAAEMKYRAVNEKFWNKKKELNGQTNGPVFEAVRQLEAETKKASDERWLAWDESDDQRELIFYWFNVNPGILYASLPKPLLVARTDTNGNFIFSIPTSKNVVLAAHVQGSLKGQAGHYFWLLPVGSSNAKKIVLNGDNVRSAKKDSELKPAEILALDSEIIVIATPHRGRDTRQNY